MGYTVAQLGSDFRAALKAHPGPAGREKVCEILKKALVDKDFVKANFDDNTPERKILYEDPELGFCILAHHYRGAKESTPHDHGRAWVVYGVQSGALEIGTYVRVEDSRGQKLVRRETVVLRPGEASAYLPGDIHDTRCLTENALVFRFTERDLRHEDQVERRVTRFVEQGGEWFAAVR